MIVLSPSLVMGGGRTWGFPWVGLVFPVLLRRLDWGVGLSSWLHNSFYYILLRGLIRVRSRNQM
jgi:hypothetical protein